MRFKEIKLETRDDDLIGFETDGAAPLPDADEQGYIENAGARIWYATYGFGPPVILLHGGLGHSGNWGYQVPALVKHGYRAVVIDSRGHGRSTRDARPFTYELMASDVSAAHVKYLSQSIPNAWLVDLPEVSHFAPLQRPGQFNAAMLAFLERVTA